MNTLFALATGLASFNATALAPLNQGATSARVAILGFRSYGGSDLAEQLSSAISGKLAGTRGFIVVERNQLESVVRELKLNESGIIDQDDTASFGKIKSVDYLVYGMINRPSYERETGKDFLGQRFTKYNAKITASIRYTSVRTAVVEAEPRITGSGGGSTQPIAYESAIKEIATQFVKTLVGSVKVTYAKVVKVDEAEKMVWLDQGSGHSVKKGDFYEVGTLETIEFDDGKKAEEFKVLGEARVDSVLDSNCKLQMGKWDEGILGVGRGFKRDDKAFARVLEARRTKTLVARQKVR